MPFFVIEPLPEEMVALKKFPKQVRARL